MQGKKMEGFAREKVFVDSSYLIKSNASISFPFCLWKSVMAAAVSENQCNWPNWHKVKDNFCLFWCKPAEC